MGSDRQVTRVEQIGVLLSLVLLASGVAELTDAVDVLPVSAYVLALWVIAVLLWVNRVSPRLE